MKKDLNDMTLGEIKKGLNRKGKKLLLMRDSEFEQLLRNNQWKYSDYDNESETGIVTLDGKPVSNEDLENAV